MSQPPFNRPSSAEVDIGRGVDALSSVEEDATAPFVNILFPVPVNDHFSRHRSQRSSAILRKTCPFHNGLCCCRIPTVGISPASILREALEQPSSNRQNTQRCSRVYE
ncbi:hypothetical protein TNIN_75261 [Trichonephila inaurata madagascariensis]|uniref:Uncharacterized protein n=1 Tax=Trichonephila inaurata madagascariensis TaxID=2747483 RepID=A0A8X6X9T6_9ARAC|nr:hypothetical protein TNIN_75261 [Trichonephila inaurata madagascariensis]